MATFKNDPLSYKVIGCALEVYKTLGPGLLEKVYQKALMKELELQNLNAEMEVPIHCLQGMRNWRRLKNRYFSRGSTYYRIKIS